METILRKNLVETICFFNLMETILQLLLSVGATFRLNLIPTSGHTQQYCYIAQRYVTILIET